MSYSNRHWKVLENEWKFCFSFIFEKIIQFETPFILKIIRIYFYLPSVFYPQMISKFTGRKQFRNCGNLIIVPCEMRSSMWIFIKSPKFNDRMKSFHCIEVTTNIRSFLHRRIESKEWIIDAVLKIDELSNRVIVSIMH